MTGAGYTDTWYGLYTGYLTSGVVTRFEIKLHSRTLSSDAPSGSLGTWIQSTATHELGRHRIVRPECLSRQHCGTREVSL